MEDKIKWPLGSHQYTFKKKVEEHKDKILNGKILSIDPATISLGYAVAKNGKVVDYGKIILDNKLPINIRLRELMKILQDDEKYDVLVVELIRGKMSHVYLKFAVGVIMAAARAPVAIEVPIQSWKAVAGRGYKKDDDKDAEMMALTVIRLAQEIDAEQRRK